MFIVYNNSDGLNAQSGNTSVQKSKSEVPKVIVIGENEVAYEKLKTQHSKLLLAVCDNNVDVAFKHWIGMMQDIQQYGEKINFDLKGVKMWLEVFYNADGTIGNIAYYLKPNSRNIGEKEVKGFLTSFMNQYKFDLSDKVPFSHYGSVSFPLLPENLSNGN